MPSPLDHILDQVSQLPPRQRAKVASACLKSLAHPPTADRRGLGRILSERARQAAAGEVAGRPARRVSAEIRKGIA